MRGCNYKRKFEELEEKFANEQGLPFASMIAREETEEVLEKANIKYRKRRLTPFISLWAFLSQVFEGDSSCRKTTERILAFFVSQGTKLFALTESAYCQAKKRLKESFLKGLAHDVGKKVSESAKEEQLWFSRRVKIMDSTGILMANTPDNQKKYPQCEKCKPDCGYPILRLAVLFCLCTGVVLELYLDPIKVSEREMFRRFYALLTPGDIALGDRGCCSYADIFLLKKQNVDCVFRVHGSKKVDFESENPRRIRLGYKDQLIEWYKPNRPKTSSWTVEEYSQFPSSMWVRELQYNVENPGFRTTKVTLVTTLLDAEIYPASALAELYQRRWDAEINLRHIKTTMKMEFINAKTPEMVRKAIFAHILIYNLIRRIMWFAAILHNVPPIRVSFKGTLDRISVYLPQLALASDPEIKKSLYQCLFWRISQDLLPIRRNRIYARCVKSRKNFPRISQSRAEYRATVLRRAS